ncbi:MAG TPA: beta-ketoacyl synthase N-terminal-like domain-containing protein, partial [Arenibacter sp.]|nr:beta-ketoacyl synthase N-terminal-like domain-containing protein [Arenibacter sp.]
MNKTYLSHNNIVSSLGFDSPTVIRNIYDGRSGIRPISDENLLPIPFYASLIDTDTLDRAFGPLGAKQDYTRLEQMFLVSLERTIKASKIELTNRVGLIISTTKGNIDTLDPSHSLPPERAYLATLGNIIKEYFGFKTEPIVLSNACVSGILAISVAKRFI